VERWNRLHPRGVARRSHVQERLAGADPIVVASDYVRAWPQLIFNHVQAPFVALGTDGFGRSDTRENLRALFEIDAAHIAAATMVSLARNGTITAARAAKAIKELGIDPDKTDPLAL
jgi:pyruvate dehydrogenase E1 component